MFWEQLPWKVIRGFDPVEVLVRLAEHRDFDYPLTFTVEDSEGNSTSRVINKETSEGSGANGGGALSRKFTICRVEALPVALRLADATGLRVIEVVVPLESN